MAYLLPLGFVICFNMPPLSFWCPSTGYRVEVSLLASFAAAFLSLSCSFPYINSSSLVEPGELKTVSQVLVDQRPLVNSQKFLDLIHVASVTEYCLWYVMCMCCSQEPSYIIIFLVNKAPPTCLHERGTSRDSCSSYADVIRSTLSQAVQVLWSS